MSEQSKPMNEKELREYISKDFLPSFISNFDWLRPIVEKINQLETENAAKEGKPSV